MIEHSSTADDAESDAVEPTSASPPIDPSLDTGLRLIGVPELRGLTRKTRRGFWHRFGREHSWHRQIYLWMGLSTAVLMTGCFLWYMWSLWLLSSEWVFVGYGLCYLGLGLAFASIAVRLRIELRAYALVTWRGANGETPTTPACYACGYDLHHRKTPTCPECGLPAPWWEEK